MSEGMALVLKAAVFAGRRHAGQRRKGASGDPYINHPLEVAQLLAGPGQVSDPVLLAAAILHDTLEDTDATRDELEEHFGQLVRSLVEEVSDDKSLPHAERKASQLARAERYSNSAKILRMADKIANTRELAESPPSGWSGERQRMYLQWASQVVEKCRGVNPSLEDAFDEILEKASRAVEGRGD